MYVFQNASICGTQTGARTKRKIDLDLFTSSLAFPPNLSLSTPLFLQIKYITADKEVITRITSKMVGCVRGGDVAHIKTLKKSDE